MRAIRLLLLIMFIGYRAAFAQTDKESASLLARNVFHLSEVMLHDVANPPAASRFYAYSTLGAYFVAKSSGSELVDIGSKMKVVPEVKAPEMIRGFNLAFASSYALLEVGKKIMPSGYLLADKQRELETEFQSKYRMSQKAIEANKAYAVSIADQVMAYAKADGYNKLSTYKKYTPNKEEGHWYPTPPEYMSPVEPQWKTIRPFFLESAGQFSPAPPAPFSLDTTSSFYKQMLEAHKVGKELTEEQILIANFWDCNPFAVAYSGHMSIGLKKISPGGHWMGITGIACQKAAIPFDSVIFIHTMVGLTLHDAFVSCWNEKFTSDRIRPETAINKYYDSQWRPLLQTPPFPEYTSGHSVVSAATSTVLTNLLGDNFSFTDSSEVYFGLPERDFSSFYQAADEAAISRLYGGIHFRDACEEGLKQGKKVGNNVISKALGSSTETTENRP